MISGTDTGYGRQSKAIQDVLPLYFRIFLVLEQKIRAGEWPEGIVMPSEQDFATEFNVSRVTIRNTMALLEEARLITRHRGRGTFVSPTAITPRPDDSTRGFISNMREFEQTTEVELHEFAERDVPADVASRSEGPLGSRALCIRRTRSSQGRPFSHSVAWVVAPESYLLNAEMLGNRTVVAALEQQGFGFSRAEQRLTAIAAAEDVAGHLKVAPGSPLICMRRSIFDAHDRLVEFIEILYNPDIYEYGVSLSREKHATSAPQWILRSDM